MKIFIYIFFVMKKLIFVFLTSILVSFSFWQDWNLPWVHIIKRQQWLAPEKYLFKDYKAYQKIIKNNEELNEKIKQDPTKYKSLLKKRAIEKQRERYMITNWKSEIKADKVIKKIDWKTLWWPIAYRHNKTKIIIHHTASLYTKNKNQKDVENFLRWIYYYHAIKRWWWDIWYNFIIDHFWNIYEWRKWWVDVIWANAKRNNVPSIWIVLIWNFNLEKPTKAQIDSLIKLSTALVKKYNIQPYKKQIYHKTSWKYPYIQDVKNYSIVGHKDAGHTACPWKYIYEMLSYIRQQVYKNLHKTRTVSYKKNIEKKKSTKNIYLGKKFTFQDKITIRLKNIKDLKLCKSSIQWLSAKCYKDTITLWYNSFFKFWTKEIFAYWEKNNYRIKVYPIFLDAIRYLMKKKAEKYLWNKINKHSIVKIKHKIYYSSLKDIENKMVSVLLYELSFFNHYEISCDKTCNIFTSKWKISNIKSFKVDKLDNLLIWINWKAINSSYLKIVANHNWKIFFTNYKRKSYVWIPWNNFRWEILIKKDYIKEIWKSIKQQFVVINKLKFYYYIAWIAEWNDQMPFEKEKVMVLLVKTYMLFYLDKWNIHPSIPKQASYNAVDDPRIFQKYVGAWYEKTSKLWIKVVKAMKDKYLSYKNYVPILPYFSCSKGFTISAKQKFGRIDTPYLTNNIDLWKCNKFYWHGVWLSWKGAEFLANKWLKYNQIINWYFPGINILSK